MTRVSLGERIAELLVEEGVDRLFSLPEVTFGKLHEALDQRDVPLIAPHHEAAAAYMAEAYAQMTGNIAVVGGSVGPGTMNLYPAIANSWSENLPVLYLGSERTTLARNSPRSSQFQCPPNLDVVRPMTKFAAVLHDPLEADTLFHEAFRQMRSGTPGPVYIGLPFDLLLEECDFGPLLTARQYRPATFLNTVSDADLHAVARELTEARAPLLVAGAGVRNSGSQRLLRELAETLGCAVIQTPSGRGALPDTHPQVFDMGIEPGLSVGRDADLVLALGTSIGELMAFAGNPYSTSQEGFPNYFGVPGKQRWIHMDRDAAALGRNRPVDRALLGDIHLELPRLNAAVHATGYQAHERLRNLVPLQKQRRAAYDALYASATYVSPIHPGRAIIEVQRALPENVVVVRDGGAFSVWEMNLLHHPISAHLSACKQGMLGTGLPYALGAALAAQGDGRRVCLITGDGAFGFHPMELETAVRYSLPVVIVVGYDAGWSLEVPYYMHVCGRTFEVDHGFMRLDDLARTLGAHGEFCEHSEEIQPAMERAFSANKPALVQIVIDREINAYQMPHSHIWTRWHADKSVYVD